MLFWSCVLIGVFSVFEFGVFFGVVFSFAFVWFLSLAFCWSCVFIRVCLVIEFGIFLELCCHSRFLGVRI